MGNGYLQRVEGKASLLHHLIVLLDEEQKETETSYIHGLEAMASLYVPIAN